MQMQLNERLAQLRRQNGYSQEGLAERLGISRQAVSKWESAVTTPDIQNLVALSELYGVALDHLIKGEPQPAPEERSPAAPGSAPLCEGCPYREVSAQLDDHMKRRAFPIWEYEYKSKAALGNLPLVHIHLGGGTPAAFYRCRAKGVIAIGNVACGVVAVGMFGAGVFSLALASLGLIAVGCLAAGLAALGSVAAGVVVMGNVALGLFTLGNLSVAKFIAAGNLVKGGLAFGNEGAGRLGQVIIGDGMATPQQKRQALELVQTHMPRAVWLARILLAMF